MKPAFGRFAFAALLLCVCPLLPFAAQEPQTAEDRLLAGMHSISAREVFGFAEELASEKYQGRLTGSPGYDAAAKWAADLLAASKVKPAGDDGSYLQHFPDPYTLVLPGAELSLAVPAGNHETIKKSYRYEQDFYPGSTSDSGSVTAEVVYVGYGITAPELDFDEYRDLDVSGKIVLVEPEAPVLPDQEPETFRKWRPYSFHDYKVQNAKRHGAAGMVYDYHIANPNCVFVNGLILTYVGSGVVDDMFAGTGKKHESLLSGIRNHRRPASFATGKILTMKSVTEHHPEGTGANVIGYIEGSDPELRREALVIGAHLDHVGMNDELMPGANDNASGVAVLLAAAKAISKYELPRARSVIFILFGAEEQGVKGSEFYVAHPFIPNDRVKGFINLESVGRGERLVAGAGKNYPSLFDVLERNNRKYVHRKLAATFSANLARPRQDAAHFMWANVPTISFGTGDAPALPYAVYHTTLDRPEILNPGIMRDLARLIFLSAVDLANAGNK